MRPTVGRKAGGELSSERNLFDCARVLFRAVRRPNQRFEVLVLQGIIRIVIDDMRAPKLFERQPKSFPPGKILNLIHDAAPVTRNFNQSSR